VSRDHRPRKRFGQHFLRDPGVVSDIIQAISPQSDDVLVEIGPGQGAITEPLARMAGRLHAVEFDRDLVQSLRTRYGNAANIQLHEADALRFDYSSLGDALRIVGNLPYNISTPLLFHLIVHRRAILDMHFMLQKEVVDRMAAMPGSKTYGRLTIMLGCFMEVVPLFDVPAEAFQPPPRVVSSVVRLAPLPEGHFPIKQPDLLAAIVSQAFSQRRKTLRNALRARVGDDILRDAGIDPGDRAEQVPIAAWVELANRLGRLQEEDALGVPRDVK